MPQVKLFKFKIKPDQKKLWLKWANELKERRREVLTTLKKEGVISEACFISECGKYIYYFFEANNFDKGNNTFMKSKKKIDIKHREITQKCLKPIAKLDELFHFKVKSKNLGNF